MIKEFKAFFTLFQKGKELADAAAWKNHQIKANSVVAVLSAGLVIAAGFGFTAHIDQETLNAAGAGIVAIVSVFNAILTVVTSARVGV
jgi:hypothetical protein